MSAKPDGGPAFPCHDRHHQLCYQGMTLRQWYAGMALQGILSNPKRHGQESIQVYIKDSFKMSDAMIAHEAENKEVA